MKSARPSSIVILTGAGISVESGIPQFRNRHGLWTHVDYRALATPEGFANNPGKVFDFYNQRRRAMARAHPNAAHHALARLEGAFRGEFLLVTQNVDDLHEAAGSRKLAHMHGELASALCEACGKRCRWMRDMTIDSVCPSCSATGRMRPDIVWFGEMPYHMDLIQERLRRADLFIAIGTSGNVYPAAQFVIDARQAGARTVEINLEPSLSVDDFAEALHGLATELVPAFVETLLAGD